MNNIRYLFLFLIVLAGACSPIDDNYKDFVDDGPITYLAKLDEAELIAIGERNRVRFMWPKLEDPRGVKAEIYWSNKQGHHTQPFDPSVATDFYINDLAEASYIFEVYILDDEGNTSVPTSVTATVYGSVWESYLNNRNIIKNDQIGADRKIVYRENADQTVLYTDFEWKQDGNAFFVQINSSDTVGYLNDFKASSFRYRTSYIPEEGGTDIFQSPWQYFVMNATEAEIDAGFDKPTNSFTLPVPNDGYWTGYEFRWVDITTGEEKSQSTTSNTITLTDYNALVVNCLRLYQFDDVSVSTTMQEYTTARYFDMDRTNWYADPETDKETGNPIATVNYKSSVNDKNKSPYLSHLLPYNNAALSNTSGDGTNSPSAHFDSDSRTYLSMVKGIGTDATDGATHSNGGVSITEPNEKPWFIIRLDPTTPQQFNYFSMRYRENGGNGAGLKPQGVTFFGSNDDDCITDESKWTQINAEPIVPTSSTADSTQPTDKGVFAPGANMESGNVPLPVTSTYKYVKVRYDLWTSASNTMQIADFKLGYYY
ncbi:MAG: DUF4998 domain-containing protein [Bacteroidales bacterium]|jgi:hypothetical protein|nr:DUF4998 domain-containing protein [Bacteroidales bacterium]